MRNVKDFITGIGKEESDVKNAEFQIKTKTLKSLIFLILSD